MTGFAVTVQSLAKRYSIGMDDQVVALDGIDLSLAPGSVTAVTGPSGSGKSTLLHLIGAMDTADSGAIHTDGRDVTSLTPGQQAEYRRTIGFVFQRFHLLPALTVLDNVAAPLLPRRQSFDVQARARELVASVGLEGREDSLPSKLSGGQQQRVAIARALINDPGLLLADEPTGNLDSQTGGEIIELMLTLRERTGMTVLVATHDIVVASRCDRIICLHDGRIVDETELDAGPEPSDMLDRIGRMDAP
jgi:putative ABC transport system ATP-binding protein